MKVLAALLMALVLASCARFGMGGGSPSPGGVDLTGAWSLQRGTAPSGPIEVPDGYRVTLAFDADGVHGQACNIYGGEYELDGSAITFSAMSMTEMACQEPMMTVEARYHEALAAVTGVARSGDTLTLSGPDAELVFSLQPPVPVADLENTYWILETLIQGETASSVRGNAWLQLVGGQLKGATGCRDLTASYALDGDRLVLSALHVAGTCSPDLADQDALVLSVLGSGATYAIDGGSLTLSGSDAGGLGYRAPGED